MPNNPLTQAELSAYTSTFPYPQIPAGYFFASPPTGAGPLAYRLFDASYISIGIINPNRLGTGSTGAGNLYLADDGTWKLVSSISLPTPTLQQVTTAGNTTTNAILAAQFQINGTTRNARLSSDNVGGFDINYNIGGTPEWRWFGGGTTALTTFKANGNVLIGTTTDAGYKLDVNGNGRFYGATEDAAGTATLRVMTANTDLGFGGNTTYSWMQSFSSKPLYINQLGNNVILNLGGGSVGIGVSSPQTKVHIGPLTGGNGTAQERLRLSGDWSTTGSGALLRFTNQHDSGTNPNAGEYNLAGIAGVDDNGFWGGALYFYTSPQGTAGGANLNARMVISSQGLVGIGTTSPTRTLTVTGPILLNVNNQGLFGKLTSGSEVSMFNIDASNNVAFGTLYNAAATLFYSGNQFDWFQYPASVGTHRMRLASSGNLLIGTTTDAGYKLDVVGSVRSTIGFQSSVDESIDADSVFLNGFKYGYINNAATNKPVSGNSHYANLGNIVLTHFDSAPNNDFYIRSKSYDGNTAWNKIWTALNDGAGSGLDADLLDGQNSSDYLRVLSGGVEASLDTYTDIGIRSVNFTGYSQHLLSWNLGGSPGTIQQLFHYNTPANGWRIRNKTDNTTWSSWGYVVMASANPGLISGTIYHSGNLTNLSQLTNGPGYITSSANITGNAATATTLQNARTITIGATGKTFNGSANVSWTLGEIQAEYQVPINTLRNNLGDPTVREAALFHGQFNNKFRFISPTLQEESADGITWTTSTRATATQLGDMMRGEGEGTSFAAIPTGTIGTYGGYRLTWAVVGITSYVFLNALYVYNSTNGNNVTIRIEAYHNTNGWQTITGPHTTNNWPGHAYIPHTTLGYSNNAAQYSQVRITFETTRNAYTNAFTIYSIEWVGGYPQGKRNAESYDRLKNVTFPADISSPGNIRSNNGTVNNILSWTSEPAGVIGTTTNHPLAFWTNNTERMRITAAGNVGIGTSSPGSKLEINGNSYQTGLRISDTTSHSTNLFQYGTVFNINSQFVGDSISIQPADYFKISTYSSGIVERLRVVNNGNVLIGTTTDAGYRLDVNGSARVSGELTLGTDNISDAWVAYTPIWSSQGGTQPNLGDGTLTGFYKKIGKTVFVRVKLNFGLTTTGGDGAWLFSLPVNAASQDGIQFPCSMLDNGFAWYQGIVNGTYSGFTDKSAIIAQSPGGANSSQGVSGAFPFGWGNGDSLQFNGSYECI